TLRCKQATQDRAEFSGRSRATEMLVCHLGSRPIHAKHLKCLAFIARITKFYFQCVLKLPFLVTAAWPGITPHYLGDREIRQLFNEVKGVMTRLLQQWQRLQTLRVALRLRFFGSYAVFAGSGALA